MEGDPMDDLLAELAQLHEYAQGLRGLLATAQRAAPAASSGSDRTATVTVVLGPDGLPESFQVRPGWHRTVAPAAFAGLVLEAFQAAVGERLERWTGTLDEHGWREGVDRLATDAGAGPAGRIPPALPRPTADPRSIDAVTEDMIKAFDDVHRFAESGVATATGRGADRSGNLTLVLSAAGLVSCTADADWVSTRSAASLMNALGEALRAARTDLAGRPEQPSGSGGLDSLLGEAFALLRDPRLVTER
jgi:hypothetical protein